MVPGTEAIDLPGRSSGPWMVDCNRWTVCKEVTVAVSSAISMTPKNQIARSHSPRLINGSVDQRAQQQNGNDLRNPVRLQPPAAPRDPYVLPDTDRWRAEAAFGGGSVCYR